MITTKNIREAHPITDLTAPFTLNGYGFRIKVTKKASDKAETLSVTGKLLGVDVSTTSLIKTEQWSDEIYKEISAAVLTNHNLEWGVEFATRYNVVFSAGDGILANSIDQHVSWGQLAVAPTTGLPTYADHTFDKWMLGESEYNFATPVTAPITLTASWLENLTVTFDSAGGSAVAPIQLLDGETATEPTDPTRAGYTFDVWTFEDVEFDFDTPITADITLVATWIENFTVSFDSDGGSAVASQEVTSGTAATEPSDPTKEGYVFDEWQLDGSAFDFATLITEDIELTATWIELFTVTFDSQGGSAVTAQEVEDGDTATEPDPAPTKADHTFQHWSLTEDGTAYNFATAITADLTLYAVWLVD